MFIIRLKNGPNPRVLAVAGTEQEARLFLYNRDYNWSRGHDGDGSGYWTKQVVTDVGGGFTSYSTRLVTIERVPLLSEEGREPTYEW